MDSKWKWGIGLGCAGVIVVPPFIWALWQHLAEYFYPRMLAWVVLLAGVLFVALTDSWFSHQMWVLEDFLKSKLRRLFRRRARAA